MISRIMRAFVRSFAANWYGKLAAVFSAVLLWQWFDSLEGYWWPETFAIVHGLLIAGAAVEFAVPGSLRHRLPLHIVLTAAVTMLLGGFEWQALPGSWKDWSAWSAWLQESAAPLQPYIGIAAAVMVLFLAASRYVRTRIQVILFNTVTLVSLAVLDSFTVIYFWDEIAWCVFIALSWLVAEHFERFRRKHPDTWGHLIDYPLSFIVPVFAVLALVMASGLFVPNVNPVLKDPYTLWMEARGESVPSFVGDKLESVSSPALERDSRSGYSREDGELGGGFRFDFSEVMTVTTSRRSYWRGETKSLYTGQGWQDSDAELTERAVSGILSEQTLPSFVDRSEAGTERISQTVTILREDPYPVLFGAPAIRSITTINGVPEMPRALAWLPDSGELRWPQSDRTPYPDTYIVNSEQLVLDEELLRSAPEPEAGFAAAYTQLPELPERLHTLAAELTSEADNAYDKVKAIELYLKDSFAYTNTPDTSKRKSDDFVDSFLFEVREGYCDYFSTAMTVLTRANGIPARWVKGYAPGVLPAEFFSGIPDEMFDPNMGGTYTVRNADAHSWVEVYFEGIGWVPFEPTPGFVYPYSLPTEASETFEPLESDVSGPAAAAGGSGGFRLPAGWAAASAAVLGLALLFFLRRPILRLWKQLRFGSLTANQLIILETEKLIRYCRKRGLERSDQETLRETIGRWSEIRRSLSDDFRDILSAFEQAKYGTWQATPEDVREVAGKVRLIRQRL